MASGALYCVFCSLSFVMAITLTPRSVGLIVSTALAAGWMGASVTQQPTPAQSTTRPVAKRPAP